MFGVDQGDVGGAQTDEPPAPLHGLDEAGPADPATPETVDPAIQQHGRPVPGLGQEMRLEILVAVQPQGFGHILAKQRQPRRLGAPGDRLADQITKRRGRAVAAHGEHAEGGIDGGDDFQVRGRPADAVEGLIGRQAGDQGGVEFSRFQQGNVLTAALGADGHHIQGRVGFVDDLGGTATKHLEPAALGRRAKGHLGLVRQGRSLKPKNQDTHQNQSTECPHDDPRSKD